MCDAVRGSAARLAQRFNGCGQRKALQQQVSRIACVRSCCLTAYHRLLPKYDRRLHCCTLRPVETADQRKARKQAEADRAHAQVQSLSGLSKFGPVKYNADLSLWAVAEVCRLSGTTAQHRAEPKFLEA